MDSEAVRRGTCFSSQLVRAESAFQQFKPRLTAVCDPDAIKERSQVS